MQEHVQLARVFGEDNGLEDFVNRKVSCTESEAWGVAVRLAMADGAYRGDAGGPWIYMNFGEQTMIMESPDS